MDELDTPKPKAPRAKLHKADKPPVIYDAVLDEETMKRHADLRAPAAELEVVAAPDMEDVEKVEEPAAAKPAASSAPESPYAVVSGKSVDDVHLSKIVYKNIKAKKSLSVHHLQRRLVEWGLPFAQLDQDGWYAEHTVDAVHEFQTKQGLPVGDLTIETLTAIFENDSNVRVLP
jgi:hypothetical protein